MWERVCFHKSFDALRSNALFLGLAIRILYFTRVAKCVADYFSGISSASRFSVLPSGWFQPRDGLARRRSARSEYTNASRSLGSTQSKVRRQARDQDRAQKVPFSRILNAVYT